MEEYFIEDSPIPVNIEKTDIILQQMKNCIAKIKLENSYGTGFFISIPLQNKNTNVLITNYHIIDHKFLEENKKIELSLNNDKQMKIINLEEKRIIYINKQFDITLIEVKEQDNIKNFLKLDENILKDNSEILYNKLSIYILHYTKSNNALVSYGILKEINNHNFLHSCNTKEGSSGSPIINLSNNKVIGIHKNWFSQKNSNKGIYLKYPLKDFYDDLNKYLYGEFLYSQITNGNSIQKQNSEFIISNHILKNSENNSNFNIENDNKTPQMSNLFNKMHYLCKVCHQFPLIKFQSINTVNVFCACKDVINVGLEYIFNNYTVLDNEKIYLLQCNEHHKKFSYYCKNCFRDICDDCLLKEKIHSKHNLRYFDKIKFGISIKVEKLKDKFNIKEEIFENNFNINDGKYTIDKLIKILINDFNNSPNNILYKTIENIYNFIFDEGKEITNIKDIDTLNTNIKDIDNLNKAEIINSIIINGQNFSNIEILGNTNLSNLNVLSLPNNNIKKISQLENINLEGLKYLDLSFNKIDDYAIPILKKINLSFLNFINLSSNDIKSFSIFKALEHYYKLKQCFIGNNQFDDDINKITDEEYYLPNVQEIDLSYGVFSNNSIKIIDKFKFPNLKKIYLNNNSLEYFEFIDKIQSKKLEKIILNNNNINKFEITIEHKNLTIIEIKNNKICNLDSLNNVINKCPKLEIINLKGNEINFKNINNKSIFKDIILKKKIKIIFLNN